MIEQNIKEMALLAVDALEDKKGEDITVIDISEVSVIADCFIIAGGSNKSQIQAMSDSVEEKLGRAGMPLKQSEGYGSANWILLDFGDVIVHIFTDDERRHYELDSLWSEAPAEEYHEEDDEADGFEGMLKVKR